MGKKKKEGKLKCFLYTRVSTKMQLEGYSLESQENKLRKYADLHEMEVVRVYSDEGKSGKNIEGRPAFVEMMDAIKDGTAQVDYVVVYKLSRFGRNTADTLNSVQDLQDNGVQLAVVEEGIDTAKSSGKLLVSVLAAVAEIERENILIQTQAGREQKATEGRWNGGFAPYGYRLENGELYVDEEEAKIIRTIYDLYTNQALGLAGVAKYLNTHGVVKKVRQNGTLARFSSAFVKGVLDNPVYMGKISYGRRRTEKKDNGRRNDFHVVKQDEFEIYDGIHEAIVSEELWNKTHEKRVRTGVKSEKLYNKGRVHLLTGILKCPVCGGPLYGNVNRKKKPDGTLYKEHFYYACKHRLDIDGHKCEYRKQWREEEVNKEVLDIIVKVLDDDMLKVKMQDWFGIGDDDEQVRAEIEKLNLSVTDIRKRIRKLEGRQDSLPVDELYDEKFENLQKRIDEFYEDIKHLNNEITQLEQKLDAEHKEVLKQHEATAEEYVEAYKALLPLGVSEAQDRDLIRSIVEKIEIFEQRQEDGRLVKSIEFKVPVEYNGEVGDKIYWDKEKQVESVCCLYRQTE